jgi:hypothetical protein
MQQTLKLNNKNRKKSWFHEEKSLVGLTPKQLLQKLNGKCKKYQEACKKE